MSEQVKKTPCCTALLAHVDAGKTTLSEALLYLSGARRNLGRVDRGDAFLDTHDLERQRGITIFSKTAVFETEHRSITLVDTPGHVDFSPETERVLPALDCAVLVVSGTDGLQAHTVTLWNLLEKNRVPTIVFFNKMDLPGADRQQRLRELLRLSDNCLDFTDGVDWDAVSLCDETALEVYLDTGTLPDPVLQELVRQRKLIPCCFGSALKLTGTDRLLEILDRYAPAAPEQETFGGVVFKITHDAQGNRLSWIRITGGSLRVRSLLSYTDLSGEQKEEKVLQIRIYSGEKFASAEEVLPGQVCAVTGLTGSYAGMGLGCHPGAGAPVLEPVMTYRVVLPEGTDAAVAVPRLRLLEQEEPELHLLCQGESIHVQIMGKVQAEVLQELVLRRFGMEIRLDSGRIFYKETIAAPVEGVGHYEPLRHYAEVHLLLEPGPRGSGLKYATKCSLDVLDANYQQLVLTHLAEKTHLGVLTGSPITDMKLTLLIGRAHLKHTEGGDFRQATYRAVRQGLMQAQSVLLEPVYRFVITVPAEQIGRAITDIRAMSGTFDPPENRGEYACLQGTVPASELGEYAQTLAAYTQGRGQLQIAPGGYAPCHNPEEVIARLAYDPEGDLENTPDSVFCAHGAGFPVKWNHVGEYMHLESPLKTEKPQVITRNIRMDDRELEAIMEREFGLVKRPLYRPPENRPAEEKQTIAPPRKQYLIVDGYNVLFAWEELAETAASDLGKARQMLLDRLISYNGYREQSLVVVFDGYKVKGNPGEKFLAHNVHVVYTKENETGDAYIESLVAGIGKNYSVRVATSDGLVQLSSLRSGVLRMSARELKNEVLAAEEEMKKHYHAGTEKKKR